MKRILFFLLFISTFVLGFSVWAATGVDPLSLSLQTMSQTNQYNNTEITSTNTNRRSTIQNQVGTTMGEHEQILDDAEQNLNDALNNLNQAVSSYDSVNNRFVR